MISFDLKCAGGHVFEIWFRSSNDFEAQRQAGQIACPICEETQVAKAIMAPAVAAKGNQRRAQTGDSYMLDSPAEGQGDRIRALMTALAKAQAEALKDSQWVGDKFAEKARAIHYGEAEDAIIHGTANVEEARAMLEEGIGVAPLLVPIAPPDQTN
ncbi:MAG: DUF1178 family protein [Sphingomonadales bacterium]|nr:DUF1178 family protein [Sphingomonadales bacterium]